jgi:hypothetical protein
VSVKPTGQFNAGWNFPVVLQELNPLGHGGQMGPAAAPHGDILHQGLELFSYPAGAWMGQTVLFHGVTNFG